MLCLLCVAVYAETGEVKNKSSFYYRLVVVMVIEVNALDRHIQCI